VFEDWVNAYSRRVWAEDHLELVTATYRWWVDADGRSGWPPTPAPVVHGWQTLYRELWTSQARTLLANVEAIAVDDPRLCRPAACVAAGEPVREWTLTKEGVTDRGVVEAEATADYETRRQAALADHLRQLPLHRRLVASEAALAGDYDARHLVVCTDCGTNATTPTATSTTAARPAEARWCRPCSNRMSCRRSPSRSPASRLVSPRRAAADDPGQNGQP